VCVFMHFPALLWIQGPLSIHIYLKTSDIPTQGENLTTQKICKVLKSVTVRGKKRPNVLHVPITADLCENLQTT